MHAPKTILQNRYLILRLIGKGGMGAVYLAQDQRLGNLVALKETLFSDDRLRKQFEHEARLLAKLRHVALPVVSDHFIEDEGQFLVMQFIAGEDLEETLKSKGCPFSEDQVLDWADQLLDALAYLHSQKPPVIHRNIKPQNLKLTNQGHIILLDFGLAKGAPGESEAMSAKSSLFGYTLIYAPLEQIQGSGTDARADLYALGATLYHLITGVAPIDALTRAKAIISGKPDPLHKIDDLNPEVTRSVAAILEKAMALDCDWRFSFASPTFYCTPNPQPLR